MFNLVLVRVLTCAEGTVGEALSFATGTIGGRKCSIQFLSAGGGNNAGCASIIAVSVFASDRACCSAAQEGEGNRLGKEASQALSLELITGLVSVVDGVFHVVSFVLSPWCPSPVETDYSTDILQCSLVRHDTAQYPSACMRPMTYA